MLIDIDPGLLESELTPSNILTLNFKPESDKKFAVIWFLSTALHFVWQARQSRKQISLIYIRDQIRAEITILRETKHKNDASKLESALNLSLM